jgi:hypothetical protein
MTLKASHQETSIKAKENAIKKLNILSISNDIGDKLKGIMSRKKVIDKGN